MRLIIAAVGKLKSRAEQELVADYQKRIAQAGRQVALGPLDIRETMESRAQTVEARLGDEADKLVTLIKDVSTVVALDETGTAITSLELAELLRAQRDDGIQDMAFLIGGPDGHGSPTKAAADRTLSLGKITLPHALARVVLAEQLYRAVTILAGHPYHRG